MYKFISFKIYLTFFFQKFSEHVYCTETRPYNQGARLTAYELVHEKIPSTLICDSMVAALMRARSISAGRFELKKNKKGIESLISQV